MSGGIDERDGGAVRAGSVLAVGIWVVCELQRGPVRQRVRSVYGIVQRSMRRGSVRVGERVDDVIV